MATPQEKLAIALKELQNLQQDTDIAIISTSDLSTPHKKLLKRNGFIKQIIKGWYISTRPDERTQSAASQAHGCGGAAEPIDRLGAGGLGETWMCGDPESVPRGHRFARCHPG